MAVTYLLACRAGAIAHRLDVVRIVDNDFDAGAEP